MPALTRAKTVIQNNQYFTLATIDDRGPWGAALAYVLGPPSCLYIFSQKTLRHGQAIINNGQIAGVIYDSTAKPAEAESIQFSGTGEIAHDLETIGFVLRAAAKRDNQPVPSEDQINETANNKETLLFRITITEAFVLDQKLYEEEGIDGRELIDVKDLFDNLI